MTAGTAGRNGRHKPAHQNSSPAEKLPPHNRDAERALLTCMMRDNGIIIEVSRSLTSAAYHTCAHGLIHRAIVELHVGGGVADIVTVAEALMRRNQLDEIGGAVYLADLWDAAPSAAAHQQYADIILDRAARRKAIEFSLNIHNLAYRDDVDVMAELASGLAEFAGPTTPGGYRYQSVDSQTFADADFRAEWLVERVLVRNQPAVIGAPRKNMKTSSAMDLAVSLGSGTPFLNTFKVYKPVRVVVISGESGEFTLQETAHRICAARNIRLADTNCRWSFELPQLANPLDRAELKRGLQADGAHAEVWRGYCGSQ